MDIIKNWDVDLRYLPYKEWNDDYIDLIKNKVEKSIWRTKFHIQPPHGLLNDPNGFSYFNNEWHLFYQFFPMGPVHGLKSWYHVSTSNLIDWKNNGIALIPSNKYDSHGVYSGSALSINDKLFLVYTGNSRDYYWNRSSYQMGAWMDKNNKVEKISSPLILPNQNYTEHFRDPQIFKYNNFFYMLLGAQDKEFKGKIITYKSKNLKNWNFVGELIFSNYDMGFMIECPNLFFSNEKVALIFCPQGLQQDILSYQNIYPNTYIIGETFDTEKNEIVNPSKLKNLDEGFDIYATQVFNSPDSRTLEVSWIGLPETIYPSDLDGWANILSVIKEISIENSKLIQRPIKEMKNLRINKKIFTGQLDNTNILIQEKCNNCYELNLTLPESSKGKITLMGDNHSKGFDIYFDTANGNIRLNRENVYQFYNGHYDTERSFSINSKKLKLQIFVDVSVIEIFINNGEQVATSRVFPNSENSSITIQGIGTDFHGYICALRQTNE